MKIKKFNESVRDMMTYDLSNFLDENGLGNINFDDLSESIIRELKDDEFKRSSLSVIYKYFD